MKTSINNPRESEYLIPGLLAKSFAKGLRWLLRKSKRRSISQPRSARSSRSGTSFRLLRSCVPRIGASRRNVAWNTRPHISGLGTDNSRQTTQPPGRTTRPVAERVDQTLDPLARAGRDGPLPRKDVRDGGLAHLGVPSDINDRAARLSRKPFHSGERRPARRSLSTPTSRGTPREIGCEAWNAACTTRRPRHRTQR